MVACVRDKSYFKKSKLRGTCANANIVVVKRKVRRRILDKYLPNTKFDELSIAFYNFMVGVKSYSHYSLYFIAI